MNREHLIIIIARMYKEAERLSQIDFQDVDMNNLRDDLVKFANSIHSISKQAIDTGKRELIASDAETVSEWIHFLMNSYGVTVNREIEYVVRKMSAHWGISTENNVLVFAHGDFAVTHFNKIDSDPLSLNVLEKRIGIRFTKEPRVIFLPQLYDGDLLFSSILFHEVGHMIERDNSIAEIIYPFISDQLINKPTGKVINNYFKTLRDNKTTTPTVIKQHIKEHVADVFGSQYVGAHILEYVKYRESSGRNVDRVDHPTFACRERLVQSMVNYMNSATNSTTDLYLNKIIDVFHKLNDIDDLCKHYIVHPDTLLEQGQPINVQTEEELFSLFNLGWSVALKGLKNLEQVRGITTGSLTINDYYTQINEGLKQSINNYMMTH